MCRVSSTPYANTADTEDNTRTASHITLCSNATVPPSCGRLPFPERRSRFYDHPLKTQAPSHPPQLRAKVKQRISTLPPQASTMAGSSFGIGQDEDGHLKTRNHRPEVRSKWVWLRYVEYHPRHTLRTRSPLAQEYDLAKTHCKSYN